MSHSLAGPGPRWNVMVEMSGCARTHFGAEPLRAYLPDVGPDGLHPRPVRWSPLFFVAPPPQDLGIPSPGGGRHLLGDSGLADAGLAHQHNQAALAGQGGI